MYYPTRSNYVILQNKMRKTIQKQLTTADDTWLPVSVSETPDDGK